MLLQRWFENHTGLLLGVCWKAEFHFVLKKRGRNKIKQTNKRPKQTLLDGPGTRPFVFLTLITRHQNFQIVYVLSFPAQCPQQHCSYCSQSTLFTHGWKDTHRIFLFFIFLCSNSITTSEVGNNRLGREKSIWAWILSFWTLLWSVTEVLKHPPSGV